jgi:ABC-2 type transport system permease protein
MKGQTLRQEWRCLRSERVLWGVVLLVALLMGYGVFNGSAWVRFQRRTLASIAAEQQERLEKLQVSLKKIDSSNGRPRGGADPRNPVTVGGTAAAPYGVLTPGPLSAFSIGQSDLYPYYFKASLQSRTTVMEADEIENPVNLLTGRFDLAFAVVYLFPLLILALTYNVISAERESGTLALALAQPVTLVSLIGRKVLLRAAVLAGLVVASALVAAIVSGVGLLEPGVLPRLLLWIVTVLTYGAFWFVLAVAINAFGKSSATNAVALSAMWLVFVLLIPASINLIAETLYPVPSRVEMIQAMREASNQATQRGSMLLARYYEDHPDLASPGAGVSAPDAAITTYAVQMEVDRLTKPIFDHFEAQTAAQQAVVNRFRFLSPAILAQNGLNDVSGTGMERYRQFRAEFDDFLTSWQGYFFRRISQKTLVSSADLDHLPQFVFRDEHADAIALRVGIGLSGLALATAIAAVFSMWRLARYSVAS